MIYSLVIERKAVKVLEKLPKAIRRRIDAAITVLRSDPFVGKRLEGDFAGAWSIRVWPYRIVYTIHQKTVTVIILRIGHRRDVYR